MTDTYVMNRSVGFVLSSGSPTDRVRNYKRKFAPLPKVSRHTPRMLNWEFEVTLHTFLTSRLGGGEWSAL